MTISTTIIKITRPNTSDSFFYDSTYYIDNIDNIRLMFDAAVKSGQILNFSETRSATNLILTREIVYPNDQARLDFSNVFYESYPTYLTTRETYCSLVGHALEITEL
jgi:hypothetical protein